MHQTFPVLLHKDSKVLHWKIFTFKDLVIFGCQKSLRGGKLMIPNQWSIFKGVIGHCFTTIEGVGSMWYGWEINDMSLMEDMYGKLGVYE